MEPTLIEEMARNLGIDRFVIEPVIAEFVLQLHKGALEYRGDFIANLRFQIGPQAFYHLLGFLDYFSDRYSWEPGIAREYLLRLGQQAEWAPFRHQMSGWKISPRPPDGVSGSEIA